MPTAKQIDAILPCCAVKRHRAYGLMTSYRISFGPGIRRSLNESFKEAKICDRTNYELTVPTLCHIQKEPNLEQAMATE